MNSLRLPLLLLISSLVGTSYAQSGNKWVKMYTGGSGIASLGVTTDASGNVYAVGYKAVGALNSESVAVKYDSMGNTLWQHSYVHPSSQYNGSNRVLVDNSGNVYVGGHGENGSGAKVLLLYKLSPTGTLLWADTIRGVTTHAFGNYLGDMAFDPQGNIVIGGSLEGPAPSGYPHFFVAKVSPTGAKLWRNRNGVNYAYNQIRKIAIDAAGNIFAAGFDSYGAPPGESWVVRKYDGAGVQLWQDLFDVDPTQNAYESAFDVKLDASGNVYVAGTAGNVANNQRNFYLRKYNTGGTVLWSQAAAGPANSPWCNATGLYVTGNGNAYITGTTRANSTATANMLTVKFNASGTVQWKKTYDAAGWDDISNSIHGSDAPESVVITGKSRTGSFYQDILTIKYKADSTTVWEKRQRSASQAEAYNVHVGANNNVYVAGGEGSQSIVIRISDADAYKRLPVTGPGTYNFSDSLNNQQNTALSLNLGTGVGTGNINVSLLRNRVANEAWCAAVVIPAFISTYRWVIDHDVTVLPTIMTLVVNLAVLNTALAPAGRTHGMMDPSRYSIYQRPLDGQGPFCKLATVFSNGLLSAQITGFSEFMIASETDSFNYTIPVGVENISLTDGGLSVYPNPSNEGSSASFQLTAPSYVKATLLDMSGREVAVLHDGPMQAGDQKLLIPTGNLSSGVYYCKLQVGGKVNSAKLFVAH